MGFITDLLKEVPLSAVLKERLTEAEKKLASSEAHTKVGLHDARCRHWIE